MKHETLAILVISIGLLAGCAAKYTWTSNPVRESQENDVYGITLEPTKQGGEFFVAFKLTVRNKTDKELEIDWNKTRYVYAGKHYGVFVFKGVDPAMLKSGTIPPDRIPPQGILVKEIAPAKMIAWTPVRKNVAADESLISPGMLPPGRNGILLVAFQNDREIAQPAAIEIVRQESR